MGMHVEGGDPVSQTGAPVKTIKEKIMGLKEKAIKAWKKNNPKAQFKATVQLYKDLHELRKEKARDSSEIDSFKDTLGEIISAKEETVEGKRDALINLRTQITTKKSDLNTKLDMDKKMTKTALGCLGAASLTALGLGIAGALVGGGYGAASLAIGLPVIVMAAIGSGLAVAETASDEKKMKRLKDIEIELDKLESDLFPEPEITLT